MIPENQGPALSLIRILFQNSRATPGMLLSLEGRASDILVNADAFDLARACHLELRRSSKKPFAEIPLQFVKSEQEFAA